MSKEATISAKPVPTAVPAATVSSERSRDGRAFEQSTRYLNVQPKLTVGAPDDPYEKEADHVADKVMRMPDNHFVQRKCADCEKEDKLHRKPLGESITPFIQRKGSGVPAVSAATSQSIESSRGGGSRMDSHTESFMSSRFGGDFSNVKIHNDGQSARLNRELSSKAFTVGNDIYFNDGQYQPGSSSGKHLLAHELTHVVQQNNFIRQKSLQKKIQRQEDDEEAIQTKSLDGGAAIQMKCSDCNDKEKIQRQEDDQEEAIQTKPLDASLNIQRACEDCKKEDEKPLPTPSPAPAPAPAPAAPAKVIHRKANDAAAPIKPATFVANTDSACSAVATAETPAAAPASSSSTESTVEVPPPAAKPSSPPAGIGNNSSDGKAAIGAATTAKPTDKPIGTKVKNAPDDPAFDAVINDARKNARKIKNHENEAVKVDKAEKNDKSKNDTEFNGGAGLVSVDCYLNFENPKQKQFNSNYYKTQLKNKIDQGIPHEEASTRAFINNKDGINAITDDTKKNVGSASNEVVSGTKKIESANAATDKGKEGILIRNGEDYQAEQTGARPKVGDAERAIPKPSSDEDLQVDQEHNAESLDKEMADNKMSDDQLAESEEPKFIDTLKEKQTAQKQICQVPAKLKETENAQLQDNDAAAKNMLDRGMGSMFANRDGHLKDVEQGQKDVKSEEDKRLDAYYAQIELIYQATQVNVTNRLKYLECSVTCKFEEAIAAGFEVFSTNVTDRLKYYYDWHIIKPDYEKEDAFTEEYVNAPFQRKINYLEWIKFQHEPGSPERTSIEKQIEDLKHQKTKLKIELIFEEEKGTFIKSLDSAIDQIADMVGAGLADAKAIISKGRDALKHEYDSLSKENQDKASDKTKDFEDRFKDLDSRVDDKENEISDGLAKQYIDSVGQLKKKFEDIRQEEALHWWERAWRKIKEIATIIYDLGKTLLNILAKAAGVIGDIIRHPIRFFGNLISGIALGFKNFIKHLPKHLEEVIFKLIMGTVPPDITLPDQWDVKGVFSFVLQILGLSKENIRLQAVKRFGEPIVQKLEQGFELFVIFKNEGFTGLWEHIKEKIGNIKDAIIEEVKTFFEEAIIKAAVEFIIAALTPASGFIKVCKAIIGIVMFLVKNLQNLLTLLDNILNSMADIAAGKIEKAALTVENAITDILVIGIKFLASLVGINLDKIQEKISKIINAVRSPVNRALAWLFDKAEEFARRTGLLKLIEKGKEKYQAGKAWATDKIEKGKEKVKGGIKKIFEWWKAKKEMKFKNGETHTLFLGGTPPNVVLMIRSKPISYKEFVQKIKITTKIAAKKKEQEDAKVNALKIAKELDQLIEDGNRLTRKGEERDISSDFKKKLDELAKETEIFTERDDGQIPVSTQPKFGPLINGFASKMHIEMLTKLGPAGTKVTAESENMNNLLLRKEKVRTFYIAGHLLNNNLHGPGFTWQNLTPLTQRANAEHQRKIESVPKTWSKSWSGF